MKVLVLSPHVDDGELGCGGTIAKLVGQAHVVHYLALSSAEKSVPPGLKIDYAKGPHRIHIHHWK